jgi:hypothetical protein
VRKVNGHEDSPEGQACFENGSDSRRRRSGFQQQHWLGEFLPCWLTLIVFSTRETVGGALFVFVCHIETVPKFALFIV